VLGLLKKDSVAASVGLVVSLLIAQRVVTFVRGIVFARALGTEQYGVYALGYFLIVITVSITGLGVPAALIRYTPRYEAQGAARWFFRKTFRLNTTVAFGVGLLVFLLPRFFSGLVYGEPSQTAVMTAVALSIPALVIMRNLVSAFFGLKLFRASSLLEFSQVAVYAVLGIALVSAYRFATVGLLSFALSMLITFPLFVPVLSRYLLGREPRLTGLDEPRFYRRLIRFTIWFTVTPILAHVFQYVDRLSLQRLMTASDQGIYSAMVNVSATISAVGFAVNNVIYPHLSTAWEKGEKNDALSNLDLAIRASSVAFTLIGLALVLLARPIILILLGHDYLAGAEVMPMLVIFHLLTISVWLFGIYPSLIERTYVTAIGLTSALPINVVLNLVLIPRMGITGAALATVLSYTVMWAVVVAICRAYGMPVSRRTFVISLLPFVLILPKAGALVAGVCVLYVSLRLTWIVSQAERRHISGDIGTFLRRLGRLQRAD
jgi:O-antigen/teichoic acid export membrane protein